MKGEIKLKSPNLEENLQISFLTATEQCNIIQSKGKYL